VPVTGYDFKRGKVATYKRAQDGSFEKTGTVTPRADLWIVYSDGSYLDQRRLGFKIRRDHFKAQLAFHQEQLRVGNVSLIINAPEAEARTLKSWLATLDFQKWRVIPTHVFSNFAEVYDFQRAEGTIVAKIDWGGGGEGVLKLGDEAAVRTFQNKLAEYTDRDLSDYCFQAYWRGDEKRFWFAGGNCLGARIIHGRDTPWSVEADDFRVESYDDNYPKNFARDLAAAQRLCDLSGISVGSVDFIGSRINEVNGGGTVLTTYENNRMIIDKRPAFLEYILSLLKSL
jgi:glutathione synthase/RimK-type ligase-like ATP-grasp enzyme